MYLCFTSTTVFTINNKLKLVFALTKPMSKNLSTVIYNWLKELKIPVSKTYIRQQLLSHPDYPSLLSITDTLTELRIENIAVQIQKNQLYKVDRI
jgi:hypothetical protein